MNKMRKAAVWSLVAAMSVGAREHTLDELLKIGVENSRTIQSVEQEMSKAQDQINLAIGGALPTVDAAANYGYSVSDAAEAAGTAPPPNAIALSLAARQPIFSQGKTLIGLRTAKLTMQTLLCKYNDAKTQVRALITGLYYEAIVARKNADVQRQALEIAQETHRLAKAKFAVGSTGELDTIQSWMNFALSQFDLQKARSDLKMAYQTILTQCVMNESADTFGVAGEIPETSFDLSLDQVLEKVRKDNRTLTQLRGTEQIERETVKLAASDFLPSASATAGLGTAAAFDDPGRLNWGSAWYGSRSVGVGLTFNLFNGTQTLQRLKEAKCDLAIFVLSEYETTDAIMLQTKGSYDTLQNAKTQLSVITEVVKLAQKAYDITKVAYGVGAKALLDLQNAELALNQARITYNSAQLSYVKSLVSLRVLMGDY